MERLGREVERNLARAGGAQGLALSSITAAWSSSVGAEIARNAWPLRLARDGTLHVATSSATWAFELDRMAAEIAERLARDLGDQAPAGLRFRPGPIPASGPDSVPAPSPPPTAATPEVAERADSVAAAIEDPDLRELVARAVRASLGRPPLGDRSDRGFW
jgi:hypothetical protein